MLIARHAVIAKNLVQIVTLIGLSGFGAALGVHHVIGYTDAVHLAPAYLGCLLFVATVIRLGFEYRKTTMTLSDSTG